MKKSVVHVLLVLILCSLVLILPTAAAVNGKIALSVFHGGHATSMEIWVINSDGSLAAGPLLYGSFTNDLNPTWSPDGNKIAFDSNRDGDTEIYIINADGNELTRITNNAAEDTYPAWSPDGTKIAFTSNRDGNYEIYVMNTDGTSQTCITKSIASDSEPAWSPDGKKIAFTSNRDGNYEIYVMNADGTSQTRITMNAASDSEPAWSPDGTKIAFTSDRDGNPEVYVMNTDGSGQTNLTNMGPVGPFGDDSSPAWSPDGTKIAFYTDRPINDQITNSIFIMNTNGSGQTSLLSGFNTVADPAWGPATASITVALPNGDENWQRGTTHSVTWNYTGSPGSTVKITVLKAGIEVGTINASTSIGSGGKGSYTWPISSTGSTGNDYKVSVQSISQPTIKDTSDNYFTITPAGTVAPSITVTAPNGGETWYKYTTRTITWSYIGTPGSTVKIVLLKGVTEVSTISSSVSIGSNGKGTYSWFVPTTLVSGSDYTVSIQSTSQPTVKDVSNANFKIYWP